MPIAFMKAGMACHVRAIHGNDAVRRRLGDMGFVEGASVTVIAEAAGGLIVEVCGARVALDADLAKRIFV